MKSIFLILLNLSFILSQKCFTENDIILNGYTYYNSNVYDLMIYKTHPAGSSILNLAKGKDMGIIFKNPKYSFHIGDSRVDRDLLKIFIGVLRNYCDTSNQTVPNTTQLPITSELSTTTKLPVTSELSITTKLPITSELSTTTQVSKNTEIFTTEKQIIYDPAIVIRNNSNNMKINFTISFLCLLFLFYILL